MRFLKLSLPIVLLFAGRVSPAREIYVVPFSHLDLYWGGTQEECLSRGIRIIEKAVALAEQYPEFRFLLEDDVFVANFADAMKGTPELAAFQRLVKEGRIEIAPKWAAIYENLPRGEALVRNVVYGKRYARGPNGRCRADTGAFYGVVCRAGDERQAKCPAGPRHAYGFHRPHDGRPDPRRQRARRCLRANFGFGGELGHR